MKNKFLKIFSLAIFLALFLSITPARAAEEKTVHLKVAALGEVLFNGDFIAQACPDSENGETETINAWCAVEQLALNKGWAISSTWFPSGVMLNGLGQYDGLDGNYWLWFSESEPGSTALNQYILTEGENLLLAYGTSPLKITVANESPFINSTTTISAFYFNTLSWQWSSAENVIFVVNGAEISDADGVYELWTSTTAPYIISAKKTGYLESGSVLTTAQLPSKNIKLKIAAPGSILFDDSLSVTACETNPGSGIFTINGYCVVSQSGLANNWSFWGNDAFLNSLGNYGNNAGGNGIYWQWFVGLEYGQTALNKHILESDENLLLVYGLNPLRISVATFSPNVNSIAIITAEEFGLDANWNPIWQTAASSTIFINSDPGIFSETGIYDLLVSSTSDYSVFAEKDGCVKSPAITLSPQINEEEENNEPIGGEGGGGGIAQEPVSAQKLDVNKAINFLASKQNQDGSFGSSIYTDWAAIALASYDKNNPASKKIKEYLLSDQDPLAGLNAVSDYARRAMALMSFNVNPYSGTKTNYIKKIIDSFNGQQFGDQGLFNDDIFVLIVLSKAGFSYEDEMIKKSAQFVLSNQGTNGSFQSSDLTAAAIQSLVQFSGQEGVFEVTQKARNYLLASQQPDGGWDNSFSTSWITQAIFSLGEKEDDWIKNNKTPGNYLFTKQAMDGGLDNGSPESTRVWATAYAVPAALGKPWPNIMSSFAKNLSENEIGAKNSNLNNQEQGLTEVNQLKNEEDNFLASDEILSTEENKKEENNPVDLEQTNINAEETVSEPGNKRNAEADFVVSNSGLGVEITNRGFSAVDNIEGQISKERENEKKSAAEENNQIEKADAKAEKPFFAGILSVVSGLSRLVLSISNFLSSIFSRILN